MDDVIRKLQEIARKQAVEQHGEYIPDLSPEEQARVHAECDAEDRALDEAVMRNRGYRWNRQQKRWVKKR